MQAELVRSRNQNRMHQTMINDRDLKVEHCVQTLNQELLIGSDSLRNRKGRKKFTFHVFDNEYRVYKDYKVIDSGQAIEELLEVYNDL